MVDRKTERTAGHGTGYAQQVLEELQADPEFAVFKLKISCDYLDIRAEYKNFRIVTSPDTAGIFLWGYLHGLKGGK